LTAGVSETGIHVYNRGGMLEEASRGTMIHEAIIITRNPAGGLHIVPMGYQEEDGYIVVAPFGPSATLDNLKRTGEATVNMTDNVAILAGCLTGRRDWPTVPSCVVDSERLQDTLAHMEVVVSRVEEDEVRPRFFCAVKHQEIHAPFKGFNRAQAAVVEAAILVSRLDRLSREKVDAEIDYLRIAIDKTAGDQERQAWNWLMERVLSFREERGGA
jgi:hypothetical protein